MKILIIKDGASDTELCIKKLDESLFSGDVEYVSNKIDALSHINQKDVYSRIILVGVSIDSKNPNSQKFQPYDLLPSIKQDQPHSEIFLISTQNDFIRKGISIAEHFNLKRQTVLIAL